MDDEDEDRRRWVLVEKMAADLKEIKENVSLIPAMSDSLKERDEGKEGR